MPAGLPYFAWVDVDEDEFAEEHMRWDESIFSFDLKQDEGDPASLIVVVRRPRNEAGNPIGLLGPGRKIWCWFALDCGPDLIRFRGRLVGVPTSIFEELVTLEFVARPFDVVEQKEDLAETLRVLPYYDEVVLDKERRDDPEVVLEGYSAIWHYDRETHELTISDEVIGEDGLVEFDGASEDGKVLWDGLGLTLSSGPLARVDVQAEFSWTQQARGTVDLTNYLVSNWPGGHNGVIGSYTLWAADWPKTGAGIGDGWKVDQSSARDLYDFTVNTKTFHQEHTINWNAWGGGSTKTSFNNSTSYIGSYIGQTVWVPGDIVTNDETQWTWAPDPIQWQGTTFGGNATYVASYSRRFAAVRSTLPMQGIQVTLVAGYEAARECTELVSFSLFADVQHILTDPEDGEALRIDDIRSVNLSESIGEGSDAYVPIGDPRRRSYIATERGNRSLEHLIALARAHLMKRARVVEIAFAPKLSRMPEITLRKNAFLVEPRVGEALGKIIGYSLSLDGADGRIKCEVRIGCTIGHGGSAVASGGEPTYCSIDYTGADYQQFTGRTVLFDSSVGYEPPSANPNDDGINFLSVLHPADVIDVGLVVTFGPEDQQAAIDAAPKFTKVVSIMGAKEKQDVEIAFLTAARREYYKNLLRENETHATFKLKSMNREFSSDYELQVTDLKIPTGYDLEAV